MNTSERRTKKEKKGEKGEITDEPALRIQIRKRCCQKGLPPSPLMWKEWKDGEEEKKKGKEI